MARSHTAWGILMLSGPGFCLHGLAGAACSSRSNLPSLPTSGHLLTPGFFCTLAPTLHLLSGVFFEIYSAINRCSSVSSLNPSRKRVHQATSEAPGCPRVTVPTLVQSTGRGHMTHSRETEAQEGPQKWPGQVGCSDALEGVFPDRS